MDTLTNSTYAKSKKDFFLTILFITLLGLSGPQALAQCPTISCPSNVVVNVDPGACDAVVNFTAPVGTDPCASGSRTFTNCGATGRFGPTQSQVNAAYFGTDLQGEVTVNTQGIQEWVVPFTGIYTIEAIGAGGGTKINGSGSPGRGAQMSGTFSLTAGQIVNVLVGQQGVQGTFIGGGGGGSFIWTNISNSLLLAAGGGGGAGHITNSNGIDASILTSGTNGNNMISGGGTNGSGGVFPGSSYWAWAAGGAGWNSNGVDGSMHSCSTNSLGGRSPMNGGFGGSGGGSAGDGGFGGGGGGNARCGAVGGGGGGGYSGGGGGAEPPSFPGGGGGGSLNSGSNQSNSSGVNSGHGLVTISWAGAPTTTTQTSGLPSGSAFPVGITTQTYEVNSTTTCSFTVEVIDNIPPSITAPADIAVDADPNSCLATGVVLGSPTTGDNCTVDVVSNDAPAHFSIGTTTVTWTVTDENGNSNTATQSVTVNPPLSGLPTNTNTSTTFCSIQEAIDDPTTLAGHIIVVPAGTYTESVDVTKAVTLQGANQGIACTGTRGAESFVDAGATGTAFTISSDGVTIDGFSIKGAVGVSSENFSELTIVNNLVEAEYLGIAVTGVSTSSATSAIADNCLQINNRLNVLSEPTAGIALGGAAGTNAITVADNEVSGDAFYGNLFFGINTVPTTTISGGNVTGATVGLGVVNSIDGVTFFPSTLDIDGFTAGSFAGPSGAFQAGIYAFTGGLSSGTDVLTLNISNVNIDGVNNETTNSAGISLSDFSDQDANTLIVANVSGSTLTNNNPRGLLAVGSTTADVTNSVFTGNGAQGTGYAFFAAETTTSGNGAADVTVENCIINHPATSPGGVTAFVTNHNGTMTATNNSIDFNGNAQARGASTTVGGGNGGPITATCNWWGTDDGATITSGITGDVTFELFLADGGDSGSAAPGFSPTGDCSGCVSGNTIENTTQSTFYCSIQEAIDAANANDEILVSEGTYDENVIVDKALTLLGANANTSCDSRVAESLIAPASGAPVTITADGVTINGFEMTAPTNGFAVEYSNRSDVSILYNNIHDVGNDAGFGGPPTNGNTVHAVRYQLDGGSYSNIDVSNNCFTAIGHDGNTFNSTSAIAFLQSTSLGTLTNVNITDNSITNVRAANVDWTLGGRIAYGILINVGGNSSFATNGKVADATIEGNTIDDLDGFISTGIGLEGNTENALVQLNVISNLSGAKIGANRAGGGLDLQAVKFEKNRYVGTVTVVHNSFETNTFVHDGTPNLGYGVANYVDASLYGVADVTCNWFGTADPFEIQDNANLDGKILNKAGAQSSFLSFLINDDINNPDCSGTGPVANLTQGTSHMTIQDGVDAANANDVLEIQVADFTEPAQAVVDKDLTLQGLGKNATILRPGEDTGTSGDTRGFILVNAGVNFTLQDLTIDGTGVLVWQAIRQRGEGTVQNVRFTEIKYNPSTNYAGTAIAAFGTGNVDVTGCDFDEIGRIGVLYFGTGINGANFTENTYTGKGIGDWLDYAVDISAGAKVNASANTISGNRGEATVDGSTSAGILVSTFFGSGTEADVTNNFISDNTTAVFVGFNASDASTATVNNNSLTNNDNGVVSTAASIDATCNWWGSAVYDDIALLVSGPVSFNPALLGGTDNDPVALGFQPDAACGNTDFVPPTAVCQNITLSLDASGQAEILDPEDLDGGSTDNAGIASFAISQSNFDCSHLGANTVVLTVTDINGNNSTCNATVTVEDNIAPTVSCAASDSRTLDQANLTYEIVGSEFDPTVSDNCDFDVAHDAGSIPNAISTGDNTTLAGWQLPIGDHDIVFTVTDDDNNVVTCTVTVEILPIELSANVTIVNDCTPREVRVQVYPEGGNVSSLIGEYFGTITSGGSFNLDMPDVAPGTYDMYVKPEGYLQRRIESVNVDPTGPLISVAGLKAGDVSSGTAIMGLNGSFNDNFINNLDLTLLLAHYNSIESGTNYNARANFNCDNFIDALDLSFISFFYFNGGEEPSN